MTEPLDAVFRTAQDLARAGRDDDAKAAFVEVLKRDPTHFGALTDLAGLALATGYRSAALTAYRQAVDCHPGNPFGLVNLANMVLEDGDAAEARALYEKALAIDPGLAFAHQGLAAALEMLGDDETAARHRAQGFAGHSVVMKPFRGTGAAPRVLLVVASRGGNIPTNVILDDHLFAVTAVYADHFDGTLPAHDVVFNAVGDADFCGDVLDKVARIAAASRTRVINPAERIAGTGRAENAARLSRLADVIVPRVASLPRAQLTAEELFRRGFAFPLLFRSPGYHTGQNFLRIESADGL